MSGKLKWIASAAIGTALLAAGCGKPAAVDSSGTPTSPDDTQPVTLTLFVQFSDDPDTFVTSHILDPLAKKFPNVTINEVRDATGSHAADLVAAGNPPDLILSSDPSITNTYKPIGLLYDMSSLIKKYHFDLNQIKGPELDAIKVQDDGHGEIYALPLYDNSMYVTFYNKDIFDKLGVPYPHDGMTWDDYLQLNKKLTVMKDGVQYNGIEPSSGTPWLNTWDPKTGQATLNTDEWVKQYEFMNQFYNTPGADWTSTRYGQSAFLTARTLAMYPFYFSMVNKFQDLEASGNPMNWDFTTFPWWSQQPGVGNRVDSHNLSISAASQHKDIAFKIIEYMLSKDVQMDLAKDGKASVLTDPIYQQNFAANIEMLKGKNMGAVFKTKPQPYLRPNPLDSVVSPFSSDAKKQIVEQHNPDIVGVLRSEEDQANKALQTAKAQQGQ